VMAMLLRRQLKKYEEDSSTQINLPSDLYAKLGLVSFEDW